MPPPVEDVSDDESTGGSIPFDDNEEAKDTKKLKQDDGDDDVPQEPEDGEYKVEKIVGHEYAKNGSLFLQVKWQGYPNPEDQTMEPEENLLEDVRELVEEYYEAQGGRPEQPQKPAIRKRKSTADVKPDPEKTEPKKRRRPRNAPVKAELPAEETEEKPWFPKGKNWEKDVKSVETIIRDTESGGLLAFLNWENGKKSKVSIETCYEKCPLKMLKFYEQHLVFKDG